MIANAEWLTRAEVRARRLRVLSIPVGVASILLWLGQIPLVLVLSDNKREESLAGHWFSLGAVQVALALASTWLYWTARRESKALGARTFATWPAVVFLVFGALGILGTVSAFVLVYLLTLAGSAGGAWGRPLRVRGRSMAPALSVADEWAAGPKPDVDAVDEATRVALAALWLHDARKEYASVPAFSNVSWQLAALGAPAELLERAHASALQEIDHARRCFALASTYAGVPLGYEPIPALAGGMTPLPKRREAALRAIARETLVDGAFIESYNAALARAGLASVRDAAAREALLRIAEDEHEHAELAWDILAWCVRIGGEPVRMEIERASATLPEAAPATYRPEHVGFVCAANAEVLYAHGRVAPEHWGPTYAACLASARARVSALLNEGKRARGRSAA